MPETTPATLRDEYEPGEEFRHLPKPTTVAELPAWWREAAKQMRAHARGHGDHRSLHVVGLRGRAIGLVRAAGELDEVLASLVADEPAPAPQE